MKDKAKAQATINAERDAGRVPDVLWQGIELAAKNIGYVFAWVVRPPMAIGSPA